MKKKKTLKIVLITLLVILLAFVGTVIFILCSVLYPDVLISGSGDKKVICVGDSITYSQGVLTSRNTDSYPAVLADLLGSEYQTYNFGLCNRTLLSTGNMPYGNEDFATESLAVDADIVIIMLGTNDSKPMNWNAAQYEAEYTQFVQAYQNMESTPDVYIMLPPRIFLEEDNSGNCNDQTLSEEVIPAICRVAESTGATLIDLYSVTESHPEWFADGLHPNADGNRAIAEEIYKILSTN